MEKLKKALGNHAFLVVGYTEDSNGVPSGPYPVGGESSLSRASQLCLAVLWLEKYKWHALSIIESKGFREVATYRRFPPLRVKETVLDGVVIRETDSSFGEDSRGRGARLSVGEGGGRIKHGTRNNNSIKRYRIRNSTND